MKEISNLGIFIPEEKEVDLGAETALMTKRAAEPVSVVRQIGSYGQLLELVSDRKLNQCLIFGIDELGSFVAVSQSSLIAKRGEIYASRGSKKWHLRLERDLYRWPILDQWYVTFGNVPCFMHRTEHGERQCVDINTERCKALELEPNKSVSGGILGSASWCYTRGLSHLFRVGDTQQYAAYTDDGKAFMLGKGMTQPEYLAAKARHAIA